MVCYTNTSISSCYQVKYIKYIKVPGTRYTGIYQEPGTRTPGHQDTRTGTMYYFTTCGKNLGHFIDYINDTTIFDYPQKYTVIMELFVIPGSRVYEG